MKKYFPVPEVPKEMPTLNEQPYSFGDCVAHIVDYEPRFNERTSDSRKGKHLLEAIDRAFEHNGKRWVELEEEVWQHLLTTLESPRCGWYNQNWIVLQNGKPVLEVATGRPRLLVIPTRFFLPYFDAVALATYEDPRKVV